MTYTITQAHYANPEHTSAIIQTVEAASVVVSIVDTPELWQQMLDSVAAVDYKAPLVVLEDPVSKLSAFLVANPDVAQLLNAAN